MADAGIIRIKAGEMYKNIDSLQSIWKQLEEAGSPTAVRC